MNGKSSLLLKIHPLLLSVIKIDALVLILPCGLSNRNSQTVLYLLFPQALNCAIRGGGGETPRHFMEWACAQKVLCGLVGWQALDYARLLSNQPPSKGKDKTSRWVASYELLQLHVSSASRIRLLQWYGVEAGEALFLLDLSSLKIPGFALISCAHISQRIHWYWTRKNPKWQRLAALLFGKNIRWIFFLSIFQTPEENSEDTNTPISLSNIGLKVIKSGVYCN